MTKRMVGVASALMTTMIATPAVAHADDPVPSVDQVVAVMTELTDPGRPAASKTDVVTPGLTPDEAGNADNRLNALNGRGYIPFNFVVTDIRSAPDNCADATVSAPRNYPYYSVAPVPIVLVRQGEHWLITHDTAVAFLDQMRSSTRHRI